MSKSVSGELKKYTIPIIERFIPALISIFVLIVCYAKKLNLSELKDYKVLFTNTISFASIFIGVVITMAALFLGYSNKLVVKKIKENNVENIISKYFTKPIMFGLILVVSSIVLPNIFEEKVILQVKIIYLISSLWVSIGIFFVGSVVRILWVMLDILKSVFEEDTNSIPKTETKEDVELKFDTDVYDN